MVPADGLTAVLKPLSDVHQFFGGKNAIAQVASAICRRVCMAETDLVRSKAAGIRLDLCRPLAARCFVQHVVGRCVVIHPDFVAKPSSQQRRSRHTQGLSRQVPKRHLDAAGRAHQGMCRAVGARARELRTANSHEGINRIDLQRVLAHQERLERLDLFLDPDARQAICLGDAVVAVVCKYFDQYIGARTGQGHGLNIGNFRCCCYRSGEPGKYAEPCATKTNRTSGSFEKVAPRPALRLTHHTPQSPATNSCCCVKSSWTTGANRAFCSDESSETKGGIGPVRATPASSRAWCRTRAGPHASRRSSRSRKRERMRLASG